MSNIKGVIAHWTVGDYTPSATDYEHYHYVIDGDAIVTDGENTPEDNFSTADDKYAAHTRGSNKGYIGVAISAMLGANEKPFKPGKFPIKENQFRKLITFTAELCKKWDIEVTPQTVLTHAEVEANLGIKQTGKWDISHLTCPPYLETAKAVGDYYRAEVSKILKKEKKK